MPQYIESNAGLLQSFIAAQNASAVNKTQSIKNIAETVAAAVNAHYKSKEDKIKEQLARIEHEKQAEIALGESKMKQATQAADILTKLRPVEPSGYANLPRINFQGSGGPLNLPGSVAPSYGYPAYPESAETTPPELKSILGPKYSRVEKTTDVTVTPDQYTQVLNAYKDKPEIVKKLSTTTQPGMKYTDFIKSVQKATEIPTGLRPGQQSAEFKSEKDLRSEFEGMTKEFRLVENSMNRIKASVTEPSAAGDLSLIYNYMKMLDPTSVVREGEFATAAATGSYGERIKAAVNKVAKGERLSKEIRADFEDRAQKLYNQQVGQFNITKETYVNLAKDYGLDPKKIVIDISGRLGNEKSVAKSDTKSTVKSAPKDEIDKALDDMFK